MSGWHRLEVSEALERLGTDATRGLSAEEAAKRPHAGARAERAPGRGAHLSLVRPARPVQERTDRHAGGGRGCPRSSGVVQEAVVIGVILLFAVVLGFTQDPAEKAIEALREMAAPAANVLRDGKELDARPRAGSRRPRPARGGRPRPGGCPDGRIDQPPGRGSRAHRRIVAAAKTSEPSRGTPGWATVRTWPLPVPPPPMGAAGRWWSPPA